MSTETEKKSVLPGWLYVLFLALVATATDEFIIAGVLPAVAEDLQVSLSAAGQLVTVFAVVYAVGAPTLAVLCERFPRRTVMVAALVFFVLANVAAALAPGYWWLMAARVAAALGAAVVASAAFATAAAGAPEGEQGRYLGIVTAGMTAALFTGVPLGSWLGGALGWRATFWLIAAVGAVAVAGLVRTAPTVRGAAVAPLRDRIGSVVAVFRAWRPGKRRRCAPRPQTPDGLKVPGGLTVPGGLRGPLRNPGVLRIVAVTFLAASGGLMFYTYLAAYAARVASDSYALLSFLLLLVGVAGLAGALLAGRLTDARGPVRSLRLVVGGHALTLLLAAVLVFSGLDSRIALAVVVGCWAVFAWGLTPPVQGSILAAAGPAAGMTALALNISGLYLGTGVAGALGGAVIATAGVAYVPVAAAALMGLSFLLTLVPAGSPAADVPATGQVPAGPN